MKTTDYLKDGPLGKKTTYTTQYDPSLLFPIPRQLKRNEIGMTKPLVFFGNDVWHAYEVSWLDLQGKPQIAVGEFIIPCESEYLIESKSMKLYLNSFNQTKLASQNELKDLITADLENAIGSPASIQIIPIDEKNITTSTSMSGQCLDQLDITIDRYTLHPDYLSTKATQASETLYTNLFKTNCLATRQPDWASLVVQYAGNQINHEGLLKYLISYRDHAGFHEHCVEQVFIDILQKCHPEKLSIEARYTRRGGISINPYRSTEKHFLPNQPYNLSR
jgi:7-cyano-7-deazaguanine reductase